MSSIGLQVWSEDDMDSEEEDLLVMGGEGFTPEELAHAEQNFTKFFVSHHTTPVRVISVKQGFCMPLPSP